MATATVTEPDVEATAAPTTKRRVKRVTYITASLLALIVTAVAVAFFLSQQEYAGNEATGGNLTVTATGLEATSTRALFPTSASDGGTAADEQSFTVNNTNPVAAKYALTAACGNCDPDSAQQKQWEQLYISIADGTGKLLYSGRIADMNDSATVGATDNLPTGPRAKGPAQLGTVGQGTAADYTKRIWLKDSGQEQPQNIVNQFSFTLKAQTV